MARDPLESNGPLVMLIGGLVMLLGLFGAAIFILASPEADITGKEVTPSQMRRIVRDFREQRRQRMMEEVSIMRGYLQEIGAIRDRRQAEADIDPETAHATLAEEEQYDRKVAAAELEELKFEEVYAVAKAVEQDMITSYREFVTARMQKVRPDLPYDLLYEQSAAPRPRRPDLNVDALYRDITTSEKGGGLEPFKDQITLSTIECREMMENCEKLLAFTRKSDQKPDSGITPDIGTDEFALVGYNGPELLPDELDFTYTPDTGSFRALPGRRLVSNGPSKTWLYIDTWYVIGPFESDRRRENLDVRFGPEANVNLDDVFTGKPRDGKPRKIRWRFQKVGWTQEGPGQQAYWKMEPVNVEAYAIYYAWTEIYSDVAREDVWIATATDDYGKLWINDELVWKSPKTRKPYNATENMQRISLKQGFNKVLYRVENAGGTMGFSLLIRLE